MKRLLSLTFGVAAPMLASAALIAPAAASAAGTCTPPYCPAPKAETTNATNVGRATATLNGIVNANGADTTYHFELGTATGTYTSADAAIAGTTSTDQAVSAAVNGLDANTTYYFRVVAISAGGPTYGAAVSFTTPSDSRDKNPTPVPGTGNGKKSRPTLVSPNSTSATTLIAKRSAATLSGIANVLQSRGAAALLGSRGVTSTFAAPSAGTLKSEVFAVALSGRAAAARSKRVLVARATHRFAKAGTAKVRLRPTANRRALGHTRRVRLLIRTMFTPTGGKPVVRGRNVTVRR